MFIPIDSILSNLPYHQSVRGILVAASLAFIFGAFIAIDNSKPKNEYPKVTGKIDYYGKTYLNFPVSHPGDIRFLKVDTHPDVFEIYEPNSEPSEKNIDELKQGDIVDIYYYEPFINKEENINRLAQFIDHNNQPYFIRNNFRQKLGFVIAGFSIPLVLMAYYFHKKRKVSW